MAPRVDPVPSDCHLPKRTSVVIVGGGIIGTMAALSLTEKGVSVVLCEKGHIAGEQSSRNLGWCRKAHRDPRELPLVVESLQMWRGINRRIGDETGFRECGILYPAKTKQELEKHEVWLEHARLYQLDTHLIGEEEVVRRLPGSSFRWVGALYSPTDGRAEPQKAAPAIARAAQRNGAVIVTNCAVRGVEFSGGRVAGVVTERGPIACDGVLLAGGVWSSLFARNLGLRLPQLKIKCTIMRTEPIEIGLRSLCQRERISDSKAIGWRLQHYPEGGRECRNRAGRFALAAGLSPDRTNAWPPSPLSHRPELLRRGPAPVALATRQSHDL